MMSFSPWKKMSTFLRRLVILIIILSMYLMLGAAIFHVIERPNEMETRESLNRYITTFMEVHKHCVSETEVEELIGIIQSASLDGIQYNETQDRWDIVSAFFFSSTIVTTIGYGRMAPATKFGTTVCVSYAFFGIPLMALLLNDMGNILKVNLKKLVRRMNSLMVVNVRNNRVIWYGTFLVTIVLSYIIVIGIPATAFAYMEGWTYQEAHYFCFISLTTIGFGDTVATSKPLSNTSRYSDKTVEIIYTILTVIYLFIGLCFLAMLLSLFQNGDRILVEVGVTPVKQTLSKTAASERAESHDVRSVSSSCDDSILPAPNHNLVVC